MFLIRGKMTKLTCAYLLYFRKFFTSGCYSYHIYLFRIADLNGDGLDDLICENKFSDISIAINDFPMKILYKQPSSFFSYCPNNQIKIGNFNGDLSMEMLCSSRSKFTVHLLIILSTFPENCLNFRMFLLF